MGRISTAIKALSTKIVGTAASGSNTADAVQHIADHYVASGQLTDAEIRAAFTTIAEAAPGCMFLLGMDEEEHLTLYPLPAGETDCVLTMMENGYPGWISPTPST